MPRRFDAALAVSAIIGNGALVVFMLTQIDVGLRVSADARQCIMLWLVIVGGVSAISWGLRPHIIHVSAAMHAGLDLAAHELGDEDHKVHLAVRRAVWSTCGVIAACSVTAAATIDIGVFTGIANLHGPNLMMTREVLLACACVTSLIRVNGPALAELDKVYRLARGSAHRRDDGDDTVIQFPRTS